MEASEKLYNALVEDFGMEGAKGSVRFNLRDFGITVEQNNIIGNILEEWLDKWMTSKGIVHIHNQKGSETLYLFGHSVSFLSFALFSHCKDC